MGGCRCTYRNCTAKSDGKTHLFHYPVFDKVRCHQWLSNAGRFEFLNLKVSQLKNRCICQHHFRDEYFMNSNKEKLKLKAVPTEDGPFCDSSKFVATGTAQSFSELYPLSIDDIENDYISDKKANFSMKYADFLTNCEPEELSQKLNATNKINIVPKKENITEDFGNLEKPKMLWLNNANSYSKNKKSLSKPIIIKSMSTPERVANVVQSVQIKSSPSENNIMPMQTLVNTNVITPKHNKHKIQIISEKKITRPLPILGEVKFEKVSPSMLLNLNKKRELKNKTKEFEQELQSSFCNITEVVDVNKEPIPTIVTTLLPVEFEPKPKEDEVQEQYPASPVGGKKIKAPIETKKKIPPERVAAIEQKRKFNMKLRDILEAGLNKLEEQEKVEDYQNVIKEQQLQSKRLLTETVATSLSKQPKLPNNEQYTISYLEARMARMENLLLNKIDQNTQKIMDLKKTLEPDESLQEPEVKRPAQIKPSQEEAVKKRLYKEISQYLSPETNSLIYEELFINKYAPQVSPPNKRKRRR